MFPILPTNELANAFICLVMLGACMYKTSELTSLSTNGDTHMQYSAPQLLLLIEIN